jgi:MFS family permease
MPEKKKPESVRTIRIFAAASFLNDLGSDIIYPIWPMFVTATLGANMAMLGLIDGLGEAVVSLSQAASGYLSDRFRRRKVFIWLGYGFGSLSRIGYALATFWTELIPFRVFDRMGKIRGAPRDAMVADSSTDQNRGRNFGLLRTMDNLGAVCGIVICLLFIDIGYQNLFLIAAIPSAIAVLLILRFIKEPEASRTRVFKGLSLRNFDRNLWMFFLASAVFALGAFSYSFLLLYARDAGLKPSMMPILYLIFTVVAALFSLPFGRFADMIGRKPVMLLSFVCWGIACLSLLAIRGTLGAIFCFIFYGLHRAAMEPVQKTLASELSPEGLRASTLGAYQMVIGLCAFPSSFVAGLLWTNIDKMTPLHLSLMLTILSGTLLSLVKEKKSAAH